MRDAASSRSMGSFVAPRDAYELRLAQLWTDVLKTDRVSVKDSFFELGDRAQAEILLAGLQAQFATTVPLPTFLAQPTVEQLACILKRNSSALHRETLVALQPRGSKPALFLVPGGDGNAFSFHQLARQLGPDQPLYGLQARGLQGEAAPHDRVENTAADYLKAVQTVQPEGPYLLGGHCSGAIVALEMALQLQRQGKRVPLVVALDAMGPTLFYQEDYLFLNEPLDFYEFIAGGYKYWHGRELKISRQEFLLLDPEQRSRHFMTLAKQADIFPPDVRADRINIVLQLFRLITRPLYTPQEVFTGQLILFRGSTSDFCVNETGGWDKHCAKPLIVHELPGNHISLVTEPNVQVLVQQLRAHLDRAVNA